MKATQEVHGFCTREAWTKWFADYNLVISNINDGNYELIQSDLPSDQWVEQYKRNSAMVRDAFCRNEEMLNQHIRWFTRTPGRWTRAVADPLLSMLFRYVTRVQDLGTAYELAESLLNFYSSLDDEIALMKCYTVRLFSCDFLDSIHLADDILDDCKIAREIYERRFLDLTPEEQSMGLSIYDVEFDILNSRLKLGRITPALLDQIIACYSANSLAIRHVIDTDQGYEFNAVLPDLEHHMGFAALCLTSDECTPEQAEVIFLAAGKRLAACEAKPESSASCLVRSRLVYHMAERLKGMRPDSQVLEEIRLLMSDFSHSLFKEGTYNQRTAEAVEAIQLATETLTKGGSIEPGLYDAVQELFIQYFATRPYTTFVDYVCATYNYCYILTALPHIKGRKRILQSLLRLTMFRQVQTAMHSIMVGNLAMELLDSIIRSRPELLVGLLHTKNIADVRKRRKKFLSYLYRGALLHDIGKLLCSSVINAQSHRLGELEFRVLKFHPVTGAEMLEKLPELSVFRDIVLGHQKSCDGASGYPAEFDNTVSSQKIFIDIITICDSLDAATDHLGRNYATAKNFSTVLKELQEGRKNRYSEELVNLMLSDTGLQKRLRYLLEDGRRDVCYEVHKMILSESRVHLDRKNTHHWLFELGIIAPDN